jgi:hypothetical protein
MVASLRTAALRAAATRRLGLDRTPRALRAIRTGLTFSAVSYAWIWFRAASVRDALYISTHLGSGWTRQALVQLRDIPNLGRFGLPLIFVGIAILELVQCYGRRTAIGRRLDALPGWGRWAVYYAAVATIVLLGVFQETRFIYFQF